MPIDLANADRKIHIGVILMGGETETLDVAPVDLFSSLTPTFFQNLPIPEEAKKSAIDVAIHWVNEHGDQAKMTANVTIQATDSFETCPPLDIVLMGATMHGYQPTSAELAFIRKSYEHCAAFLAICGGFVPAMMAGILHGKTATCPRPMIDRMKRDVPDVKWVESRWARDGKMWTSGALLNGLDMVREFALETWGRDEGTLIPEVIELGGWPSRANNYGAVPRKVNV